MSIKMIVFSMEYGVLSAIPFLGGDGHSVIEELLKIFSLINFYSQEIPQ